MTRSKLSRASINPGPHIVSDSLAQARRKLLDLEPGGSRARPLEVASSAVIEPKATGVPCPRCSGAFELVSHEAHAGSHGRLREVRVACRHCGERRTFWFRIVSAS